MVLARKQPTYTDEPDKKQQSKKVVKKKKQKRYILEKFIVAFAIAIVFSCSILILTRYMSIVQIRHSVNKLERQLQELEVEKTKLKIDVEKVSKSGWIENEAKNRLKMNYPTSEQIVHININQAKIAVLTNEINKSKNDNFSSQEENRNLGTFIKRLISYVKF